MIIGAIMALQKIRSIHMKNNRLHQIVLLKTKMRLLSAGALVFNSMWCCRQKLLCGSLLLLLTSSIQACRGREQKNSTPTDSTNTLDYDTCYRSLVLADTLHEPDSKKEAINQSKANNSSSLKDTVADMPSVN